MKKILLITGVTLFLLALQEKGFSQTPLKPRDPSVSGPQTFAIIMGISNYKYVRPLTYADKDAELFRDFLQSPGGGSLKEDNIFCLLNNQALSANFWTKGFQWLRYKQLQKGDRLFIYLAGHGDAIDEDQYFFLGYDCNPAGDKNNYLVGGAIQLYNLKKKIAAETAKGVEVFFVMDACRSNELPGGAEGLSFLNTAVTEKKVGEIMMLATAAGQESLEDASIGNGHGLFTWYLVDGLTGVADSEGKPDNKVTLTEIRNYVEKNVPSVARQRFKKTQQPYFCCEANNENIISQVDAAWLQKWLQQKKQSKAGDSFEGWSQLSTNFYYADTTLLETYQLFNNAIREKKLTGNASAEFYYQQLDKNYKGNPYTLDAQSTLAAEFINDAQQRVNRYLECTDEPSAKEKKENYEAGERLWKAISLVREDDPDFANALLGRMYLLKSNNEEMAFQNAYAALKIDPNGAYIQNKLALLHLANNKTDSALFYADKAARTAPKWTCALTTLALVQKAISSNTKDPAKKSTSNSPLKKARFGFTLGGGLNRSNPAFSGNVNSGFIAVDANTAPGGNLGVICQVSLGNTISIRPAVTVNVENTDIDFIRRSATGEPAVIQTVAVKGTAVTIALPLIIRLTSRNIAPYIALGPSFNYLLSQNSSSSALLPVKKALFLGDGGLGVDFNLLKSGIVLSPELKYSAGLSDWKDTNSNTAYANALSSLKKNAFTVSLYLRKR
ncbi:MAG TPA: caspase family protein [Chitinophagaceae bacterium]|nr:caspase family protein [Chitinophagaceae bacterium]